MCRYWQNMPEVGNAANTIFSFITRQKHLTFLESGINVLDAANTNLAGDDILSEIVAKWRDNVDSMSDSLVELAENRHLSEEI